MKKYSSLESFANDVLNRNESFDKLVNIAGKKDYPGKLKRIKNKVEEEMELWVRKGSTSKLDDLKKDLDFIESVVDYSEIEKERIDLLASKYSIGYGEVKRNPY